jgi:hypothetical protein
VHLAIVRRRVGDDAPGAIELLESAVAGMEDVLGATHHFTLTGLAELATSLWTVGRFDRARGADERALQGLEDLLGRVHPHSLACAANLAGDLAALGEAQAGGDLLAETMVSYADALPDDHIDVIDLREGRRVVLDLEPVPL